MENHTIFLLVGFLLGNGFALGVYIGITSPKLEARRNDPEGDNA